MEVDEEFCIEWVAESDQDEQQSIQDHTEMLDEDDIIEEEYLVGEEIIPSTEINTIPNSLDQIAAENLIYMAQDGNVRIMGDLIEEQVEQAENADYNEHQYFECQVTEEVITDDWVQQQGEERVEIPVDQLGGDVPIEDDIDVPLPTDQDEYTTSRPYPCDFCSRRFRKKANLMNHMVAHKNDRPHICNLCGARYIRKVDLLNHLKVHAQVPEEEQDVEENIHVPIKKEPKGRKPAKPPKAAKHTKKQKQEQQHHTTKHEYIQEDLGLLIEAAQKHEHYAPDLQADRYPIIDPARPFVCQTCGVSFAREKALLSHSKMHGVDSPFECDSCSEMFWDLSLLREHQKIHHAGQSSNSEYEPENEKEFSESDNDSKYGDYYCNVCGMSFHRPDLLRRHAKSHTNIKYEQREIMEENTTTEHCCNVCGESFIEALELLAHTEVHARFQPFKCMLCGESFLEEGTIKKHLSNLHSHELTDNSCRLCGKHCRDARSLMKHSWEHSSEKNHSCSKCGKTFHNKARLKRHMQSHRNKSVTCDVCGDDFPDGRSLMNHRHSHTNVSGRQFPCKDCGKTFGSRSSQQIHMRIHTGERPYGCRFCWKAFADGGTLRKHERIHTGEKPYACPVCPRAFNQRVVLREHIRSHHSGPDKKNGNSSTPYSCSVCGDLFATSLQVIQHLIEHSDMNTAMKRQPPTGPRKYKRRRKLKPHELERLRAEKKNCDFSDDDDNMGNQSHNMDDDGLEDDHMSYVMEKPTARQSTVRNKAPREKKLSFSGVVSEVTNYGVMQNLENTLQSLDSLVMPSGSSTNLPNNVHNISNMAMNAVPSSSSNNTTSRARVAAKKRATKLEQQNANRPKMIHTQKMRVPVDDGKRKTRTLITRTAAPKEVREHNTSSSRSKRNRYEEVVKEEEDIINKGYSEAEILLELSRKNLKYSPDVVNDLEEILRSPIKSKDPPDEYITSDPFPMGELYSHRPQRTSARRSAAAAAAAASASATKNKKVSKSSRNKNNNVREQEYETEEQTKEEEDDDSHQHYQQQQHHHRQQPEDEEDDYYNRQHHQDQSEEPSQMLQVQIKQEKEEHFSTAEDTFTCEMCSAVFADRGQLLLHVPIHI